MLVDVIEIVRKAYQIVDQPTPEDAFILMSPWVFDSLGGPLDFQEMFTFLRKLFAHIDKNDELKLMGIDEAICQTFLVMLGIRMTKDEVLLGSPDPNIYPVTGDGKNYARKYAPR